ncbi:MAG TPA: hypothetical protein VGH90_10935, partial [Chthoniobacteraceae bacterium]
GGSFGGPTILTINAKIGGHFLAMECTDSGTPGEYVGPVFNPGIGATAANGQARLAFTAIQ